MGILEVVELPGTTGWKECALWVPNGRGTLIACDALQHYVDQSHTTMMARIVTSMMGFKGGLIVAPMWRKYQKVHGAALTQTMSQLAGFAFENLVTGHGPPAIGGADVAARAAIARASA